MGLERLLARLSRLFVVLLALALAYVVVSIVFALAARVEFPSWPLLTLLLAGLAVTGVYAVLVIALRGRKRKLVTALSAEAKAWPEGQAARAAGLTGLKLTRVAGFRAHARTPHSAGTRRWTRSTRWSSTGPRRRSRRLPSPGAIRRSCVARSR